MAMSETAAATRDLERFRQFLTVGFPGPHAYAILLGLDVFDLPSVLKEVEKGFAYKSFERLVRNMGMPAEDVAALVGIPKRTLARRKIEKRFQPDESDRLLRIARVFAKALRLFDGDRDAAIEWLTTLEIALGTIPLQLVRTELGAQQVENVLGAIAHGMFL